MGLFSAIGSIFGGGSQKKASQRATDAIVGALNRGIDTQNAFNQQVRQDYLPYTQTGAKAVGRYGDLVGLNGNDAAQVGIDALKNSALYASLFNNGQEALLQNAAATGGLRGGNTQRASLDFGADVLAKVYQDQLANLGNLASLGVGAQGAVTQAGSNTANNVTNLLGEIGGAQANNYLAKGRINAQNWQTAGSAIDDAISSFVPGGSLLKSIFGGGATAASTARLNPAARNLIATQGSIF